MGFCTAPSRLLASPEHIHRTLVRRAALHAARGFRLGARAVKAAAILRARVLRFAAGVAHGFTFKPSPFAAFRCRSSKL